MWPRRSRWPDLRWGPAGAIQAKDWLQASRNPFTLLRLGVWGACLFGVALADPYLTGMMGSHRDNLVLALGLGIAVVCGSELIAAAFSTEGCRLSLFAVAGIRPASILGGKLLATIPFTALSTASIWWVSVFVGSEPRGQWRLTLTGATIAAGMSAIMIGIGALDAMLRDDSGPQDSELMAAAFEQVPIGIASWAGLAAALLLAGVSGWAAISWGWRRTILSIGLMTMGAVLALSLGFWRLRQTKAACEAAPGHTSGLRFPTGVAAPAPGAGGLAAGFCIPSEAVSSASMRLTASCFFATGPGRSSCHLELIRGIKEEGTTIFLVEQNARAALRLANRAYVSETGEIVLERYCGKVGYKSGHRQGLPW